MARRIYGSRESKELAHEKKVQSPLWDVHIRIHECVYRQYCRPYAARNRFRATYCAASGPTNGSLDISSWVCLWTFDREPSFRSLWTHESGTVLELIVPHL
jgi:hypothetical protein